MNNPLAEILDCLQGYAADQSNPVLSILGQPAQLVRDQKYPDPYLGSKTNCWRAYYHYHETPCAASQEHGHFHIFLRTEDKNGVRWPHLAALAMDRQGQPLRWFTVNAWVTGGDWVDAETLTRGMRLLDDNLPLDCRTERWLQAMVRLYRLLLTNVLIARDQQLIQLKNQTGISDILRDRSVYEIGSESIDLLSDLSARAG